MKANFLITRLFIGVVSLFLLGVVEAANTPAWTFTPLTATTLSVPSNDTAVVQYQVTNQSRRTLTLIMQPIQGITQLTTGLGICGNPFVLVYGASCTLSLQVNGSQLIEPISDGPIVTEQGSSLQSYRPAQSDILHITQASPITTATITVTGSPLTLTTNGPTGTLTINNTSLIVAATNITSNFTSTALNGNVTETGNTCASVAPRSSCTLTYTPGSTVVSQTDFPIQGTNTNAVTAAIQINAGITLTSVSPSSGPASGGAGVTLTGIGLTGATGITFGNVAATDVYVVNSTTVTAVTTAHVVSAVDVVITTPGGSATLTNGYTYLTTAIGQSAYGGTIACLGGNLNNLIAATADHIASPIKWADYSWSATNAKTTNGATNTTTIVNCFSISGVSGCPGNINVNTYAAGVCSTYEVDSQGHSPCQTGNHCYNTGWFLPAGYNSDHIDAQLNCLYTNRVAIGGFARAYYWSSTEATDTEAWYQNFHGGLPSYGFKDYTFQVRCVRSFTP